MFILIAWLSGFDFGEQLRKFRTGEVTLVQGPVGQCASDKVGEAGDAKPDPGTGLILRDVRLEFGYKLFGICERQAGMNSALGDELLDERPGKCGEDVKREPSQRQMRTIVRIQISHDVAYRDEDLGFPFAEWHLARVPEPGPLAVPKLCFGSRDRFGEGQSS